MNAISMMVLCISMLVIAGCTEPFSPQERAINEARATVLIQALARYHQDTGSLPEHVADLVPLYLTEVPQTTRNQEYRYIIGNLQSLLWHTNGSCMYWLLLLERL